jgi:hypothetical protein
MQVLLTICENYPNLNDADFVGAERGPEAKDEIPDKVRCLYKDRRARGKLPKPTADNGELSDPHEWREESDEKLL